MFAEDALLPLSGLQHLTFCERQAALIHLERVWLDNALTVEGSHLHETANSGRGESRVDVHTARSVGLRSLRLGLTGKADVIEFHRSQDPPGVALPGRGGRWRPFPVEYKRGRPKPYRADEVQLCAQALCLEEMLRTPVPAGALFYGVTRRRLDVAFDPTLRETTESAATRFQELFASGVTPNATWAPKCRACSLQELCRPKLSGKSTSRYVNDLFRPQSLPEPRMTR